MEYTWDDWNKVKTRIQLDRIEAKLDQLLTAKQGKVKDFDKRKALKARRRKALAEVHD